MGQTFPPPSHAHFTAEDLRLRTSGIESGGGAAAARIETRLQHLPTPTTRAAVPTGTIPTSPNFSQPHLEPKGQREVGLVLKQALSTGS